MSPLKRMFENFRDIQVNLQQKQMTGQEITQEEVEQAQKTVALVQQHDKISQLMEAEQRVSVLIGELNKIIMKPLEELYGNPEEKTNGKGDVIRPFLFYLFSSISFKKKGCRST
ncbi:hypothetical protein BsIDN1_18170 [Bacillus safensis]|uniref:Uncharacterized protein n=1 Tax=Bacillus safensis TaxID=561879 RepID=A0A5S9M8C7_BACIA|nr:hypothetical protein BsIDN1_18170 [Bacillus safensis]